MHFLVIILSGAALVPIFYFIWRLRWGYPPASIPRVLAYHKVTGFEFGGNWMPAGRFIAQVDSLLNSGFRFIDEDTFLRTLEGVRRGSGREILLTFDDGYRELLRNAIPAIEKRGIPALIFLVSSFVGCENRWELYWPGRRFRHLDWDEIVDLAGRGFSFGSHTLTHRDLVRMPLEEACDELVCSKKELEVRLGRTVNSLSYPFGRTNAAVAEAAARAGYRAAFSLCPACPNSHVDRFALRREGVYIVDTIFNLKVKLGTGPLFWIEDLKGRAINSVAVLTPLLKGVRSQHP